MGGMVSLTATLDHPVRMAEHVAGLVLVATTPGPVSGVPLWPLVTRRATALAGRTLTSAERHGWGLLPGEDLASWSTRLAFGSRPTPLDLELTRSLTSAMSPSAMADLLVSLVAFDVRGRLGEIRLPTRIVAGSRDLLLPLFHARRMAAAIPDAVRRSCPDAGTWRCSNARISSTSCSTSSRCRSSLLPARPDRARSSRPNGPQPGGGTIRPWPSRPHWPISPGRHRPVPDALCRSTAPKWCSG